MPASVAPSVIGCGRRRDVGLRPSKTSPPRCVPASLCPMRACRDGSRALRPSMRHRLGTDAPACEDVGRKSHRTQATERECRESAATTCSHPPSPSRPREGKTAHIAPSASSPMLPTQDHAPPVIRSGRSSLASQREPPTKHPAYTHVGRATTQARTGCRGRRLTKAPRTTSQTRNDLSRKAQGPNPPRTQQGTQQPKPGGV